MERRMHTRKHKEEQVKFWHRVERWSGRGVMHMSWASWKVLLLVLAAPSRPATLPKISMRTTVTPLGEDFGPVGMINCFLGINPQNVGKK